MQDFLKNIFGKQDKTKSLSTQFIDNSFDGVEFFKDTKSVSSYNSSIYVKTAMDKINTVFSSAEIELFLLKNTNGDVNAIVDHEILSILEKPNDYQNKTEFMSQWAIFMKLSGECFIKKIRDNKKLIGLVIISPENVIVEIKDNNIVYKVCIGNKQNEYSTDEIIHTKKPNPCNPLRGVGALSSIVGRINAEEYATQTQNNALSNGNIPNGMIILKGVDKESVSSFGNKVKNTFSGKNNGNKLMVSGIQDAQQIDYTKLDFGTDSNSLIANMQFLRDDISAALGVPKSLLTSDDVNLANATTGYKQFINFTIEPMIDEFVEMLNENIIAVEYTEPLFFKSNKIETRDKASIITELTAGIDKWITINDARRLSGLPSIENGDELYRQNSTIKLQDIGIVPATIVQNNFIPRYAKNIVLKRETIFKNVMKGMDLFDIKELKDKFIKSTHTIQDRNINKFDAFINKFFVNQEKEIVSKILDTETDILSIVVSQSNDSVKYLLKEVQPIFLEMALFAGKSGSENIKSFQVNKDNFFLSNSLINKINKRLRFFTNSVSSTTQQTLIDVVTTGLDNGYGRDKIASIIQDTFTNIKKTRAITISQTEGTAISNMGLLESYSQSSVVDGKKWLTVEDHKVRKEHQENNKQVVAKNEAFRNGEHYPAEHSINCRCVIAPVIKI